MSISQNFPDEGPSLNLNFASSRILDPRITFTRTSTGTYLSNNGLVTIASANTPRFDHSYNGSNVESLGLLVEESRTNLTTYSEQFDNAAWSKFNAGITTNTSATTAPDGTNSAEKLVENTASNVEHIAYVGRTASNETVTLSVFAKAAERGYVSLQLSNFLNAAAQVIFNLSNGAIVSTGLTSADYTAISGTTIAYPNGWYRCILTATKGTVNTTNNPSIIIYNGSATQYTGDGTSGIYLWGAQLEAGAFATSYIPTVASTVTRSADNASMTGTNFSSWYNSTAATGGTISVQARRGYSGNFSGYPTLYEIGDGTSNNRILLNGADAIAQLTPYEFKTGGVLQIDYVFLSISTTNLFKSIHAFSTNNSTFGANGTLTTTDTSVTLPIVNRLNIGTTGGGGNPWNGTISSLSYYPTRLTNSQLQNLTK
jgi:hypothetical protein